MKKLLLALALTLLPSLAWAQCTGVFPPNTLCGNLSGSPAPPSAFTSAGTIAGPGSSTVNDIAVWNNTSGTLLKDVPFLTICGSNIFSSSLVGCVPASGGGVTTFLRADSTFATPPTFGSGAPGYVPSSGGGTTNFLRADGTFASPPGTPNGSLYAPSQANVSASSQSTTGTISAASSTLTLALAKDFVNGQGIRVNHAGAAVTVGQPSSATATPTGTSGSTTYTYTIASIDSNGGIGAAITNFTTTTGNATLSTTNYNALSWSAGSGSPAGYAVYGRISGSLQLLAIVPSTTYNDVGTLYSVFMTPPTWVPSTPPGSALADWLVTTVSSGGGTTTLTLAAAATTAATTQTVIHDDTVAIQAVITNGTTNNLAVNLGYGTYVITSQLTASAGALNMYGTRNGSNGFWVTSPSQTGILLNSTANNSYLHDFQMWGNDYGGGNVLAASDSTSGIFISASSNHGTDWFERLNLNNGANCLSISGPSPTVLNNVFGCIANSLITNSIGDSYIAGNNFYQNSIPGVAAANGIVAGGNTGGLRIVNNKFNGSFYGIGIAVTMSSGGDGDLFIFHNSIENWTNNAIVVDHTGSLGFINIMIASNEISVGAISVLSTSQAILFPATTAGFADVTINNNMINNNSTTNAINIGNVNRFIIAKNTLDGAATNGIIVAAAATDGLIDDNRIVAGYTNKYANSSTTTTIIDHVGLAQAALPATAANGSQIFVNNGTPASSPCTGGSTGSMAFRQNGAWKCF